MRARCRLKAAGTGRIGLACLAALLVSCADRPLVTTGAAGTTGTAGITGAGGAAGMGGTPGSPIWSETSSSIQVACFQFFAGSMHFAATRDQLSAAQLAMLSNMRAIDAVPSCIEDVMECSLSIEQADASTFTIDAIETNSHCDNPRKVVSYDTFSPFLGSLGCQYAKNLTYGSPATTPVRADARCFNGLFITDGATIRVGLEVDDATRAYRIELDSCVQPGRIGKLSFSLLDSDDVTVLGTSSAPADPGANGSCASVEQTFPHTGLFTLNVQVASGALPGGDLYLRFY
jgi:hypothetical protein